jgi:hypothetical protein
LSGGRRGQHSLLYSSSERKKKKVNAKENGADAINLITRLGNRQQIRLAG